MNTEATWRRRLETLMLELDPAHAARLAQLWRESRATWLLLLPSPTAGQRALLVGDARTGTAAGLARLGWQVTVLDPLDEHRTFATDRGLSTGAPVAATASPDESFELVLVEDAHALDVEDAAALSTDLVALTTDNGLAYKRSSGARADFHTTHPLTFLRHLFFDRASRLGPQKQRLARALGSPDPTRAAALYPDRRDYTFAVDLDRGQPHVVVGPKERANKLKLVGHALGLFPHLTPSFGLWASRKPEPRTRFVDDVLGALEVELGIPPGTHTAEHLVATRGNTALVTTDAGWLVRVPLAHRADDAVRRNAKNLAHLQSRHPSLPTPSPLFCGELTPRAGAPPLFVTVETRLEGLGAGQLAGHTTASARLLSELAPVLCKLETRPPVPLDRAALEQLFAPRFHVVTQHCPGPATRAALAELEAELYSRATGLTIGRVTAHRDLRPKHVIATPGGPDAGRLAGFVGWPCLEEDGPPLLDLFHFIAHERINRPGWSTRRAWLELQDRTNLEPPERAAVEEYEAALDLPPTWYAIIARIWPVLFGAMAEEYWDYSRPDWLHRVFGIGAPFAE
jgi:hypothetical protein